MKTRIFPCCLASFLALLLCACSLAPQTPPTVSPGASPTPGRTAASTPAPTATVTVDLPPQLQENGKGGYTLQVYDMATAEVVTLELEEYLCGVVAAEMKNTWPAEALKAQAVLARTFLLTYLQEHPHSMHSEEADISTDIKESQAYDATAVNDAVRQAVQQTRGQVLCYDGVPIKAWFHASSGGMTATAVEGLAYEKGEPAYITPVASDESLAPPEVQQWQADFTQAQLLEALAELGQSFQRIDSVAIGEKGPSGRVMTLVINKVSVSAPRLRVALGGQLFRSTLLDELRYTDGTLRLQGQGYGHGVGMSQYGAYTMAQQQADYITIVEHYYPRCTLQQLW